MSKGINLLNHFDRPKNDGHRVKYSEYGVSCYCPVARDHVSAISTSNGVKCNHCQKTINV